MIIEKFPEKLGFVKCRARELYEHEYEQQLWPWKSRNLTRWKQQSYNNAKPSWLFDSRFYHRWWFGAGRGHCTQIRWVLLFQNSNANRIIEHFHYKILKHSWLSGNHFFLKKKSRCLHKQNDADDDRFSTLRCQNFHIRYQAISWEDCIRVGPRQEFIHTGWRQHRRRPRWGYGLNNSKIWQNHSQRELCRNRLSFLALWRQEGQNAQREILSQRY